MRFTKLAGRPVPWPELLAGALRSSRNRIMWLSALRLEEARDDLTDELVAHALWLVATREGARTLTRRAYERRREELVAEDRALHGDDGILERTLPTGNQILAYCDLEWENALKLAGMTSAVRQPRPGRKPPPQRPGMAVAEMIAIYAALNGTWPSKADARALRRQLRRPHGRPGRPDRAAAGQSR